MVGGTSRRCRRDKLQPLRGATVKFAEANFTVAGTMVGVFTDHGTVWNEFKQLLSSIVLVFGYRNSM